MKTQFSIDSEPYTAFETEIANYFGLPVQILSRMEHCSLVRYRDREFIVNTEDLCFQRSMRCAA